jgi:outer membrane protein
MVRFSRVAFGSALAAALLFTTCPVQAQDQEQSHAASGSDWLVTLGLGAHATPQYPGAKTLVIAPVPSIGFRHFGSPIPFQAPDQSASIGLLGHRHGFDFGPAGTVRLKRDQDDVGAPVGNVGFTVEAGAFVQAWAGPHIRVRAEARKGIGGHHGLLGDLSADLVLRDDDRTIFSIGPRLHFADDRFENAYFGISPAASARTGIPVYRPGNGLYAAGAVASIVHQLSPAWGVNAYVGYNRLVRGAGDSPIVQRFGSRDQLSGGIGITYTFAYRPH